VLSSADRKGKAWMPSPWGPSARVSDPSDSGNQENEELFGLVPPWE
jgi:hypothetical protein